jgi:hypothetical protein
VHRCRHKEHVQGRHVDTYVQPGCSGTSATGMLWGLTLLRAHCHTTSDSFQQFPTLDVERHAEIGKEHSPNQGCRFLSAEGQSARRGIPCSLIPRRQRNFAHLGPARARPLCESTRRRRWLGQAAVQACQHAERRERAGRPVSAPQMVRIQGRGVNQESPASACSSL